MTMTPEEITRIRDLLCNPSHRDLSRRIATLEESVAKITDSLEQKMDSLYKLGYTLLISVVATLVTIVFSLLK